GNHAVVLVVGLTKLARDARDDLVTPVARPRRILEPARRRREVDDVVRPAHQHLAVDVDALPHALVQLLVVHPVTALVANAPTAPFVGLHCRSRLTAMYAESPLSAPAWPSTMLFNGRPFTDRPRRQSAPRCSRSRAAFQLRVFAAVISAVDSLGPMAFRSAPRSRSSVNV